MRVTVKSSTCCILSSFGTSANGNPNSKLARMPVSKQNEKECLPTMLITNETINE